MLADQDARDAIATALDETLVVEAAAGTGKTTELVKRILRILATGRAQVHQVVAVTFTEKAAGELKLRLREALERERVAAEDDEVRGRLDVALGSLEEAHVNTIHGFCAELLRERPVEAGIDPLFAVLTEAQSQRLFDEAFGGWLQEQLQDPPEGIRRALVRPVFAGFGAVPRQGGPIDRLRRAAWELADWRDFTAAWTRRPFDRHAAISRLIDEVRAFAALTSGPAYARDTLYLDTEAVRRLAREIDLRASLTPDGPGGVRVSADADTWEARFVDLSRDRTLSRARQGRGREYKPGVPRDAVLAALSTLRAALDGFRMDADADLAAVLQQELAGAVTRYEALKARAGALDFLDLLLKARDLVKGNALVRRGFQQRFTHLFIDEFQDTDPLQAELLLLLASSDPTATDWRAIHPIPGRLFIVGDPKQSIYRFRRADVGIYRDVAARLEAAGARPVKLTTSFRSVPNIQACINDAFSKVMTGDLVTLQADYVSLTPHRADTPGQPSVVVLPVPEPYGTRNLSAVAMEKSLPDAVGAFVAWVVNESGWKVSAPRDGDAAPRTVQPRDVCLLFRRFLSFGEDATLPYVHALEARGVHHVLVGGKTFHDREEVETIRAALAAIEWPDDELSVFATLRGALFAIGDEELLDWKSRYGRFHPFRLPQGDVPAYLGPVVEALHILQRLHRRRNVVPVPETILELLNATRAYVGLVLRAAGEQALANVLHVSELARQYEGSGGISFRGFVDELRVAAATAQAGEAPVLEEGGAGVRLMTVHKAKGLEFPIVILADLTCKLSRAEAGRWIDPANSLCALKIGGWAPFELLLHDAEEAARDRAEAERIAYVAATRARDVLVIPAIGDGPYEGGWLDPLTPAIYPPVKARRDSKPAPGCPAVKSKDTVLNRPDFEPAHASTVAPGLHVFPGESQPSHHVTWWDPHTLHLHAEPSFGLRRDDLIVKDGDAAAVAGRLGAYQQWSSEKARVIGAASVPALHVQTATAWAAEAARQGVDQAIADAADIEIVEASPAAASRPRGPRFGTLVHAVLATAPLDANPGAVRRIAGVQGRMIAASPDEVDAAAAVVSTVLSHELMTRARVSGAVRRETPVTWLQPDGVLVEGVLDLAFDDEGSTIVVDFKTDHQLAEAEARYRAQVQQYVQAVARVTGRPARGVLFRV